MFPAHQLTHVVVIRAAVFTKQRDRRHDLARCAITALKRVVFDERLLDWVEQIAVGEPFDRRDVLASDGSRKRQAREYTAAFDVNRARPTLSVVAAFLRARQLEMF